MRPSCGRRRSAMSMLDMILKRAGDRVFAAGSAGASPRGQYAVDAIAHAIRFLVGLDVDIRGALFDRVDQHQVAQLDDRRLLGLVGAVDDVEVVGVGGIEVDIVEFDVRKHVLIRLERIGGLVVALDGSFDRRVGAHHRLDV